MTNTEFDGLGVPVIGGRPPPAPTRTRRVWLVALLPALVVSVFVVGRAATRNPDDERAARAFAAAIDAGNHARARELIDDPTLLMWPTYWSVLNTEHISPFGDRLDDYVDYHRELETVVNLANCTTRISTPDEPTGHDSWVRCGYLLTDTLSRLLQGPAAPSSGQVSFGFRDGRIRTVFVIRSDRPPELTEFRSWLSLTHFEEYQSLLQQPAVLQIDVPIMGLVVTDYNRETASVLVRFAEEYKAAGF